MSKRLPFSIGPDRVPRNTVTQASALPHFPLIAHYRSLCEHLHEPAFWALKESSCPRTRDVTRGMEFCAKVGGHLLDLLGSQGLFERAACLYWQVEGNSEGSGVQLDVGHQLHGKELRRFLHCGAPSVTILSPLLHSCFSFSSARAVFSTRLLCPPPRSSLRFVLFTHRASPLLRLSLSLVVPTALPSLVLYLSAIDW